MLALSVPQFWYAFLQIAITIAFGITAMRAWRRSRARFVELVTAFLFGLLLEQGDIFLFGTYRYDPHWVLLGDVPIAIAMTWAMIIAGAMNMTDALGICDFSQDRRGPFDLAGLVRGLPAPMADAVWAILLDLAIDAVAIRLGLWTWTIRADEGWFGVPWGNFFAWLMVAFWFSFFTRWVRVIQTPAGLHDNATQGVSGHIETMRVVKEGGKENLSSPAKYAQWFVPVFAFGALILTLVPFVAIENTAALPWVPDHTTAYNNEVWILFAAAMVCFAGVTLWTIVDAMRVARDAPDHWLLFVRLSIHVLFLLALLGAGIVRDAPLLAVVALMLLAVELLLTRRWLSEWMRMARSFVTARSMERAE